MRVAACFSTVVFLFVLTTLGAEPATKPGKPAEAAYVAAPNYKPTRNLSQFFAKIKAGKPVTVMGIGGSVTEGHSWAYLSAQWLREQFPGKDIRYVDGAYGGTGPTLTIFRSGETSSRSSRTSCLSNTR